MLIIVAHIQSGSENQAQELAPNSEETKHQKYLNLTYACI